MSQTYQSWGGIPKGWHAHTTRVRWQDELSFAVAQKNVLPYGLGRSYGDSCLNYEGNLIDVSGLNHFISFNETTGMLRCEAGVSLAQILEVFVPRGYFLPVTPGTKFVTIGGAIANDVHGKNHHVAGTFGCHVPQFELLRSDGTRLTCSKNQNSDYYEATIGGLGLTGVILWADVRLKHIASAAIDQEVVKYKTLDEFFKLSEQSEATHEYTVSWVDCTARGGSLGRGHFMRGDHSLSDDHDLDYRPSTKASVPFYFPNFALNEFTVKAFNNLYYHRQQAREVNNTVNFDKFFYPLDAILNWNRIYGRRGFFQYQFVVPLGDGPDRVAGILETIAASGMASFLAVLKVFGDKPSPGLLSFPMPGVTLALDFANVGEKALTLFNKLDDMVAEAGGRVYPAKDARMSATHFKTFFPQHTKLAKYVDPNFSSSFWRRVEGGKS